MYEKYEKLKNTKNLSDYQVSKEAGVARSVLSDWKNGKHTPNLDNLQKIARYFNVSIEELLS